jgi:HEAT repeat protein
MLDTLLRTKAFALHLIRGFGRSWRMPGGCCCALGLLLWIGLAGYAEADLDVERQAVDIEEPLRDWEEPGMSAALQDVARGTRYEAISRLGFRPTKNTELIRLASGFLDDPESTRSALDALTSAGTEAIQRYTPRIAALLNDKDENIRQAAAAALNTLGLAGQTYAPQVKSILDEANRGVSHGLSRSDDWAYKLEIAEKLSVAELRGIFIISDDSVGSLGLAGRQSKTLGEKLARLLIDADPHVSASAAATLGLMRKNAQAYIPQLTRLLASPNRKVRMAAVTALIRLGGVDKLSANQLKDLLGSDNYRGFLNLIRRSELSTEVMQALMPKLIELLNDPTVGHASAQLIGRMGEAASPYAAQLAKRLDSQDPTTQWDAASILLKMGSAARPYLAGHVALIGGWLDETDPADRVAAVEMLGALGETARPYVPRIGAMLNNCADSCDSIVTALGEIGEASQAFAPQIAYLYVKGINYHVRALYRLGKLSQPDAWLSLLAVAHEYPEKKHQVRVDAYLLFGHDPQMREATAWLGKRRQGEYPDITELSKPAKIKAIEALRLALQYPGNSDLRDVAVESATHISRLVESQAWVLEDAP